MASIEKRGNGHYRFSVYLGEDAKGKAIFKRKSYKPEATEATPKKLEKELQTACSLFEKQVKEGAYYDEKFTLNQFYEIWLRDYGSKELTPAEIEGNERTMRKEWLPAIGHLPLTGIRGFHIQSVINEFSERELKPKTIQKYFSHLSTVFTRAYKLELIENNPAQRVSLPRNQRDGKIHTFTPSEAVTFLNAVENGVSVYHPEIVRKSGRVIPAYTEHRTYSLQFLAYFNVAISGGLRRGETIGLRWCDVHFDKSLITVSHATSSAKSEGGQFDKAPKTRAGFRTVPMTPESMDVLKRWKEEQTILRASLGSAWEGRYDNKQFIFITDTGKQMNLDTPAHKLKEIINAYNSTNPKEPLPQIRLHDLRHSSAVLLVNAGVDITVIAKRLGHSDVSTTMRNYLHPTEEMDNKAVNALSLAFELAKGKSEKTVNTIEPKSSDKRDRNGIVTYAN